MEPQTLIIEWRVLKNEKDLSDNLIIEFDNESSIIQVIGRPWTKLRGTEKLIQVLQGVANGS